MLLNSLNLSYLIHIMGKIKGPTPKWCCKSLEHRNHLEQYLAQVSAIQTLDIIMS